MSRIEFRDPMFLLLLVPYAAMVFLYIFAKLYESESAISVPSRGILKKRDSIRARTYRFLPVLRFLALFFLIIALSRPGRGIDYTSVKNLGIDIMIALDVSGSMRGEDFQPNNRLAVAKQVVKGFIENRKSDRIGMTVFAGEAYLQCPLTIEHDILKEIIDDIDFETVPVDGTAIGDALALSGSRMMDSKSKSKIILLITDGVNNRGSVDPETAAKAMNGLGIKIYSVAIGRDGRVPYPGPAGSIFGRRYVDNHFDPAVLEKISGMTGGKYYRAASTGVLWENISDIDRLEKSEIDLKSYHEFHDRFFDFLLASISLFFLEVILRSVFYRKIP
ncbi:MAG: VWA domain-containing protein [Spirochaetes bacterium]|jgi:Ca-activated chloride channel family protein|nr:VWA domain-containing protein [Spirochaetota bacterium]